MKTKSGSTRIGRLWAGWRRAYVTNERKKPLLGSESIFEDLFLSDDPDSKRYVLWEGDHCAAILNLYPYVSGHVLILPKRAVPSLQQLTDEESNELWEITNLAVTAITEAYKPHGINVGVNIGKAAGASIPEHLHMHCLPRWEGDTTFLTTLAETRMIPETLSSSYERLKKHWPSRD